MGWLKHRGVHQWARPGSKRERMMLNRGAEPVDEQTVFGDQPETSPAVEAEPKPVRKTVETVVDEASDADLETVHRLLEEEYVGANRKTAIEQLERIRARKAEES